MKKINLLLKEKRSFAFSAKLTATIIVIIISHTIAVAQTEYVDLCQAFYKPTLNAPKIEIPELVTITGTVKNEEGKALSNAKVRTDFGADYLTDNEGKFSFMLKKEQVTSQSIFISYENLVTAVRSYTPAMINGSYDIVLYKPVVCCKTPPPPPCITFKPSTLVFKNANNNLSEETKKELDKIATSLKECPDSKIFLTGHEGPQKSAQKSADKRLDNIKNYLIEQNGIPSNRIQIDKVTDKDNGNIVDIKPE